MQLQHLLPLVAALASTSNANPLPVEHVEAPEPAPLQKRCWVAGSCGNIAGIGGNLASTITGAFSAGVPNWGAIGSAGAWGDKNWCNSIAPTIGVKGDKLAGALKDCTPGYVRADAQFGINIDIAAKLFNCDSKDVQVYQGPPPSADSTTQTSPSMPATPSKPAGDSGDSGDTGDSGDSGSTQGSTTTTGATGGDTKYYCHPKQPKPCHQCKKTCNSGCS